jgi:hypothetical protein
MELIIDNDKQTYDYYDYSESFNNSFKIDNNTIISKYSSFFEQINIINNNQSNDQIFENNFMNSSSNQSWSNNSNGQKDQLSSININIIKLENNSSISDQYNQSNTNFTKNYSILDQYSQLNASFTNNSSILDQFNRLDVNFTNNSSLKTMIYKNDQKDEFSSLDINNMILENNSSISDQYNQSNVNITNNSSVLNHSNTNFTNNYYILDQYSQLNASFTNNSSVLNHSNTNFTNNYSISDQYNQSNTSFTNNSSILDQFNRLDVNSTNNSSLKTKMIYKNYQKDEFSSLDINNMKLENSSSILDQYNQSNAINQSSKLNNDQKSISSINFDENSFIINPQDPLNDQYLPEKVKSSKKTQLEEINFNSDQIYYNDYVYLESNKDQNSEYETNLEKDYSYYNYSYARPQQILYNNLKFLNKLNLLRYFSMRNKIRKRILLHRILLLSKNKMYNIY